MHDDVIASLRAIGISDEAIARAVERGDPEGAIFDAILLPTIERRTVSAAEVEATGGLTAEETANLVESFGLPRPDPDAPLLTPEEAEVLREVGRTRDVWPLDVRNRLARVMGRHLAAIAHAQVLQFLHQFEAELGADAGDREAALAYVQESAARLLPLSAPFLVGVHRRWIEHELAQAAVGRAESAGVRLPGAMDVTIVFCDLTGYTQLADLYGDDAAVAAIDDFTDVVLRERGERLRRIKALGDGFMLCYADVHEAVAATARIVAAMADHGSARAHASIHQGTAIARDGDYFGSAVNLTARLLAVAEEDEIIATAPVAEATAHAFAWRPAGTMELRGFTEPVATHRLLVD